MPADMRTTFASARLVVARSWKPPKRPPAGAGHQRGTATRRGSAQRRGRAGVPLGGGATPGARAVGFHLRGAEDKRSWLVEAEAHGRAGPRLRGRRPGFPPRPSVPTRLPPGSRDRGHPEAVLTGVVLPAASGVWTRTVLQKFLGLDTGRCVLHPKAGRRYVRRDRVQTRGRRRSELSPCPSTADAWARGLCVHGPGRGPRRPPDCRGDARLAQGLSEGLFPRVRRCTPDVTGSTAARLLRCHSGICTPTL